MHGIDFGKETSEKGQDHFKHEEGIGEQIKMLCWRAL
jgi:hypothetical protein